MTENYTEKTQSFAEKFFEFFLRTQSFLQKNSVFLRFRLGRIEKKCNFAFLIVLVLGNNQ